jgi:hypothetical protein
MNTKVAVGLIVLTAIGTYGVSRSRRHHFEPTKLGDGSILLDTETGVECSARFDMKWTDDDKRSVWAAGLAAKKTEKEYNDFIPAFIPASEPIPTGATTLPPPRPYKPGDILPPPQPLPLAGSSCMVFATDEKVEKCNDLFVAMQNADSEYNALVKKADNKKIPDPDSSYFKNFPLCKNIR